MEILVLSKKDLENVLTMKDTIDTVQEAFKGLATGESIIPPIILMDAPKHNGAWGIKAGVLNNQDVIGLKLSCGYFENPKKYNLPSIMGVVVVADLKNGTPLALMDGLQVTAYRTGAVAGVAARHLARKDCEVAAICGAGAQGRTQLIGLNEIFKLKEIRVYDIVRELREKYAKEMSMKLGLNVKPVDNASDALGGADVVSTATPSKEPYIKSEWIEPGTHITTVGSDEGNKQELDSSIYYKAKVVVDKREVALNKKYLKPELIYAELGEIIAGMKPGRTSPDEITVMDSTGLGIQDVAAGLAAYRLAKDKGIGTWTELF
ncbi:MAG TPA: ornithine cyclodeaminase family protein [Candidatus Bathyarchaeia archaeon]|nr:ornithine cyclodeaminase family protein [Candidatus Bathyarchaeia archaeon]